MVRIIDLHCDTLTECYKRGIGLDNPQTAFSTAKIPDEMSICQAAAVFMPDTIRGECAWDYFEAVSGFYANEVIRLGLRTVTDMYKAGEAIDAAPVSLFLTIEGGSALAGRIENIERAYEKGVRMMTLTWNAENEICGGCSTDLGFTAFGRTAVREMERLGIAADVSHLSDRGFYELCEFSQKPFIASHSNSRKICGHARNLTDDMFKHIVSGGGLVGLNYYDNFIKENGGSVTVDDLIRHVYYFLELGGENTLALGSDFDGADIPPYLDSVEKHLYLLEAMEKAGIPAEITEKIAYKNSLRFFAVYNNCSSL